MIVGLSLFAIRALGGPTTNAPAVTLGWDPMDDSSVSGFVVYWGTSSRQYTNSIAVPGVTNTTCTISNLVRSTHYYFAATSKSTNGLESDYSNEADYTTLAVPPIPGGVRVSVKNP